MLSPEQIGSAADAVGAVYAGIEAEMLDYLVGRLLDGLSLGQKGLTALALLAQTHGPDLARILARSQAAIDEAAREAVERALRASDADDVERLGGGEPLWPRQVRATVAGVAEILARDNLAMAEGAKRAFLSASIEAVTRVSSGAWTTERALHAAVRKLEREGVPIVTYRNAQTGVVTVENHVDVAVRRHVRTQIAQDGMRMTLERMEGLGVALVEVSSHEDARPSHAAWHGRVYSLHGEVEMDGVRYPDFYSSCRWGDLSAGIGGPNCRHSFGPYRHGAPRAYGPNPESASGLPGEEVYAWEQRQRRAERRIRTAKRELRGAQAVHERFGSMESAAQLAAAKDGLKRAQEGIRSLVEEANAESKTGKPVLHRNRRREWAGDMPRTRGDVQVGRSVGAAAMRDQVRLPDGTISRITKGTRITGVKVIAGAGARRKIDCVDRLVEKHGGKREGWSKRRGTGYVDDLGMSRGCELHWYEEETVGRVDMKVKRYYY